MGMRRPRRVPKESATRASRLHSCFAKSFYCIDTVQLSRLRAVGASAGLRLRAHWHGRTHRVAVALLVRARLGLRSQGGDDGELTFKFQRAAARHLVSDLQAGEDLHVTRVGDANLDFMGDEGFAFAQENIAG